ncbi:hypothetical protein ABIA33_005095 [Streptacidiphilus sp. MAP12-16]|uniref:hypothetical protein n=1 Tax=Streptacidiphilus sp. MAP12-16 TaxID=3156300 RepID=UPI003517ADCC
MRHHDIDLEPHTGPLQGVYDPSGPGAALFALVAHDDMADYARALESGLLSVLAARDCSARPGMAASACAGGSAPTAG